MRPRTFLRQRNLSSQRGKKSFFSSPYPRHNFWCVHVMRLSSSLLLSFILCASYFFLLRLLCLHFSFFCAGTCLEQWRLWCSCCLRRTSVTLCATSSSSNSATDRPSSPRANSSCQAAAPASSAATAARAQPLAAPTSTGGGEAFFAANANPCRPLLLRSQAVMAHLRRVTCGRCFQPPRKCFPLPPPSSPSLPSPCATL